MNIKYTISFKLRQFGRKTIRHQIRIRCTFNSQRFDITSGWNLKSANAWNESEERVRKGYVGKHGETSSDINLDLSMKRDQLVSVFKYYEALDQIPTPAEVIAKYNDRLDGIIPKNPKSDTPAGKKKDCRILSVFDQFMNEEKEKNAWSDATYKKMLSLKVDLAAFNEKLIFSHLTESTLTSFVKYLREEKSLHTPRKKKEDREIGSDEDLIGLRNSTIEKKLGYLRWFLNWATDKGYNTTMDFRNFRPTLKQTQKKVIYLTKEELAKLRACKIPKDRAALEDVRNVFLFCCFSGLRHSDVYNLRRSDIKDGKIDVTTVKTADSISIELNKVTKEILDKYKDFSFKDNRALPVIQNQPMNRELKDLCKLAGIDEQIRITTYSGNQRKDEIKHKWELVGTHTGRRTFIVNALSLGIAPNVVMKWTGHSDYKAMKPYIDIVDSIKADAMTKMDGLLN